MHTVFYKHSSTHTHIHTHNYAHFLSKLDTKTTVHLKTMNLNCNTRSNIFLYALVDMSSEHTFYFYICRNSVKVLTSTCSCVMRTYFSSLVGVGGGGGVLIIIFHLHGYLPCPVAQVFCSEKQHPCHDIGCSHINACMH